MEQSGRNPRQRQANALPRNRHIYLRSAADDCHRLRTTFDGKEGVDGSSPSEGSAKAPHVGAFSFSSTCSSSNVRWVWSRLWSFHAGEGAEKRSRSQTRGESLAAGIVKRRYGSRTGEVKDVVGGAVRRSGWT